MGGICVTVGGFIAYGKELLRVSPPEVAVLNTFFSTALQTDVRLDCFAPVRADL